jgi:DNA-binding transcriptional LysR family regulator
VAALDPRRLLVLDAVVREGSMTAAATRLGYTQSAVSQAVAALEKEAGTPLLERYARGVRPTAAGEVLARHAAIVREQLERAAGELEDLGHLRAGRLRLAAFPSAASVLLPPAVAAFRAAHPEVELSLAETETAEAVDGLREGVYDLAVVFDYAFAPVLDPAGLVVHDLGPDEMLVALPPGHRAAERDVIPIAELAGETWVSSADPTCNLLLTHGAQEAGFTPRVAFASDDYGAVGRLVVAGVGIALIPELASPAAGDAVELRRLEPPPVRSLHVALPGPPSAAARAMVDEISSARDRSTSRAPARSSARTPPASPRAAAR